MGNYMLEFMGGPWDGGVAKCYEAPEIVYLALTGKKGVGSLGEYFSESFVHREDPSNTKARYRLDPSHQCCDPEHKVYRHEPRPKDRNGAGLTKAPA